MNLVKMISYFLLGALAEVSNDICDNEARLRRCTLCSRTVLKFPTKIHSWAEPAFFGIRFPAVLDWSN